MNRICQLKQCFFDSKLRTFDFERRMLFFGVSGDKVLVGAIVAPMGGNSDSQEIALEGDASGQMLKDLTADVLWIEVQQH